MFTKERKDQINHLSDMTINQVKDTGCMKRVLSFETTECIQVMCTTGQCKLSKTPQTFQKLRTTPNLSVCTGQTFPLLVDRSHGARSLKENDLASGVYLANFSCFWKKKTCWPPVEMNVICTNGTVFCGADLGLLGLCNDAQE